LKDKTTEIKTGVKYSVKQFLKLDLDKLPTRNIRELLLNFNPEALKIHKNRKKLLCSLRNANEYCYG